MISLCIQGTVRVPGSPCDLDSHRAEVTGILGIVYTLHQHIPLWATTFPVHVTIACDNDAALYHSLDIQRYPEIDCSFPDFDLLQQIRQLLLPQVTYIFQEVKGHQDSTITALTLWEILNVRMDSAAKSVRVQLTESRPSETWWPELPLPSWRVQLADNTQVCKNFSSIIQHHTGRSQMQAYWHRREKIPNNSLTLLTGRHLGGL
jgi:hypothetical protein